MLYHKSYCVTVEKIVVPTVSAPSMALDVMGVAAVPVALATISLINWIAFSESVKIQSSQTLVSRSISRE
jgi:hypothetical protein